MPVVWRESDVDLARKGLSRVPDSNSRTKILPTPSTSLRSLSALPVASQRQPRQSASVACSLLPSSALNDFLIFKQVSHHSFKVPS